MASANNNGQVSKTDFWPRVKEYIRDKTSAREGPLKCDCPVCLEQMDIVGLPIDATQEQHKAVFFPCGHMVCTDCFDELKNTHKNCPTCRSPFKCQHCSRAVAPCPIPTSNEHVESAEEVFLTTSEGGSFDAACVPCTIRKSWKELIKDEQYPRGAENLQVGFVPLVYNIMERLELSQIPATKPEIERRFVMMLQENLEWLDAHRQPWRERMRRGHWPVQLSLLMPGFVPFVYSVPNSPEPLSEDFISAVFRMYMGRHFKTLERARVRYFADETARLKRDGNEWFAGE